MTVVTQTDLPKSVRNRYEIEVFRGVFVLSINFRIFSLYKGFCHRTESDLLLFLFLEERNLCLTVTPLTAVISDSDVRTVLVNLWAWINFAERFAGRPLLLFRLYPQSCPIHTFYSWPNWHFVMHLVMFICSTITKLLFGLNTFRYWIAFWRQLWYYNCFE